MNPHNSVLFKLSFSFFCYKTYGWKRHHSTFICSLSRPHILQPPPSSLPIFLLLKPSVLGRPLPPNLFLSSPPYLQPPTSPFSSFLPLLLSFPSRPFFSYSLPLFPSYLPFFPTSSPLLPHLIFSLPPFLLPYRVPALSVYSSRSFSSDLASLSFHF